MCDPHVANTSRHGKHYLSYTFAVNTNMSQPSPSYHWCHLYVFDAQVRFVPASGLSAENVSKRTPDGALCAWYNGPTLLEAIDSFTAAPRAMDKPFRMCIADVTSSGKVGARGCCTRRTVRRQRCSVRVSFCCTVIALQGVSTFVVVAVFFLQVLERCV